MGRVALVGRLAARPAAAARGGCAAAADGGRRDHCADRWARPARGDRPAVREHSHCDGWTRRRRQCRLPTVCEQPRDHRPGQLGGPHRRSRGRRPQRSVSGHTGRGGRPRRHARTWVLGRATGGVDQPQLTQGNWVDDGGVVLEAAFADSLGLARVTGSRSTTGRSRSSASRSARRRRPIRGPASPPAGSGRR